LHFGEVAVVPVPDPACFRLHGSLSRWINEKARGRGRAATQFPYRPFPELHFWTADIAYAPLADWERIDSDEWPVYSPPFIVEVLSPSNRRRKLDQQRLAALSNGTREFWIVNRAKREIEVHLLGAATRTYGARDVISIKTMNGARFPVRLLFE
jgi:Uma2 family endonuclease